MSELHHQKSRASCGFFIVTGIILCMASLFLFLSAFQYIDQIQSGAWAGLLLLITCMNICISPLLFVAGGLMIAVGATRVVRKRGKLWTL